MTNAAILDARSIELRATILEMVAAAGRGHIGPAFSIVEIVRVLYDDIMRFDPQQPRWRDRDRFLLSKGHGCLALYPILAEKGYFQVSELGRFCRKGSFLAGHPVHEIPGVEASTGSLGHGLSIGVGFAINAQYERATYRTFVLIGDGESNEGSVWEAALSASKHRLSRLTVLIDRNKQQSYGPTSVVLDLEPYADKWRSFGFETLEVDGHDVTALREALRRVPAAPDRPTAIICHTVKGRGLDAAENNPAWHHHSRIARSDVDAFLTELRGTRA